MDCCSLRVGLRVFRQLADILPAIDFGVHREEVVHVPDHAELAGNVADFFVLQREIFAVEQRARE